MEIVRYVNHEKLRQSQLPPTEISNPTVVQTLLTMRERIAGENWKGKTDAKGLPFRSD